MNGINANNKKKRDKRIKRLRKAHVWPSVLFVIIGSVVGIFAAAFCMGMLLSYFVADRLISEHSNMINISNMFYKGQTVEDSKQVLSFLETDSDFTDAIYILDSDGEELAGFGGATYSNQMFFIDVADHDSDIGYVLDKNAKYAIFDDKMDVRVDNIISNYLGGALVIGPIETQDISAKEMFSFNSKVVLFDDPIWMMTDIPDGRMLMMKCHIKLYNGDILLSFFLGSFTFVLMMVPVLLLLISAIHNLVNQHRMTKLLYLDTVTGGRNWIYFEHQAYKVLHSMFNKKKSFAVVDVSLLKYRAYCTCHGVDEGEELLSRIDDYFNKHINKKEICVHYGKSDFALLLRVDDKEIFEERVIDMLDDLRNEIGSESLIFHAGICFVDPFYKDGETNASTRKDVDVGKYYNQASAARATVFDDTSNAVVIFDDQLLEEQIWEHQVEEKMQKALDNEEFQVYIQPKYNPVNEELAGAEALVRWIDSEDNFISPGRFIPIFEKNGFITKLDDYMISHVAKLQSKWLSEGKSVVPISVNVSRAHFANPDLAKHIAALVDEYKLPHNLLEIELTESAFFDDKAALLNTVKELKNTGFVVSMDDFGAGYSSLNSLKDLPLDVLKLDADFFRGEDGEERGEIVVSQAIRLAKKLNMKIVAEGVEKKNQVDFLASQNCDMIQGFYYAKPMPAAEYSERL